MDDQEILNLELLESSHWWYMIRKKILRDWLQGIPKGSKILDLGSASGGNTHVMISQGFDVTSLEFSQVGVDIQLKKGIPVIKGDARETKLPSNTFDACVCLDVLEHILEDSLVLKEIHRVLKPGGFFLLSVPEDMALWSEHDVAVSHVRRYEKYKFVQQIESTGLLVNNARSVNVLVKPILKMKRKFSHGSDLGQMSPLMNKLLMFVAEIDWRLNKSSWSGVTIWVKGKK